MQFARFIHAEDSAHEIPPRAPFPPPRSRSKPYIYTPGEIKSLLEAARRIRATYPLRRQVYTALLGLIAATGLRISEALDLLLDDVLPDGILRIRDTKFGKTRLVPLHPTVVDALGRYLDVRRKVAATDDHVFLSAGNARISSSMVNFTFRRILVLSGVGSGAERPPRIHDLRHSFATRALEKCENRREAVGRHFVALATYLGHADIKSTYWYLEATAELMTAMAAAAETLLAGEES
jgi:integrase